MNINIDRLEDKFKDEGYPYWKLYEGRSTRKCIAKNLDLENMDESWEMLDKKLEYFENGSFTLEAFSSPFAKRDGALVTSFRIGEVSSNTSSRSGGRSQAPRQNPMMDFMQMFTMIQKMGNDQMAAQNKLMMESLRAEYENRRLLDRIDDLENMEPQTSQELQDVKEVIGMITGGQPLFRPNFNTQPPVQTSAVGTIGQKDNNTNTTEKDNTSPIQSGQIDINHLLAVARQLGKMYPEYHPNKLLDGLMVFLMNNKPMADNIIHNIMKPKTAT